MASIPCSQCAGGTLRLVRFEGGAGLWACRQCGYETRLLDCHGCEHTLVRRLGRNAAGTAVWACVSCRQPQWACPACGAGWLQRDAAGGAHCARCGRHWGDAHALCDAGVSGR